MRAVPIRRRRVEVDVNTPGDGVYVAWSNSEDLSKGVSRAVRRRDFSDPVLLVHGEALRIMFEALIALLRTAGFVVSESEGYREYQVRVEGVSDGIMEAMMRSIEGAD